MNFQIKKVNIRRSERKVQVIKALHEYDFIRVAPLEISVDINGIACYYINSGKEIIIWPYPGSDVNMIHDQLLKWGTICILHQRKIPNFHASSFGIKDKGVMVLGDTGAGKSTLNAAFSLDEAVFLNDDITAITLRDKKYGILKLGEKIALTSDSMKQLGQHESTGISPGEFKQEIKPDKVGRAFTPLKYIINLETETRNNITIKEVEGTEKFALLRSNICSWEILKGIPGLEKEYLEHILEICKDVPVFQVRRPERIDVKELKAAVYAQILYDR